MEGKIAASVRAVRRKTSNFAHLLCNFPRACHAWPGRPSPQVEKKKQSNKNRIFDDDGEGWGWGLGGQVDKREIMAVNQSSQTHTKENNKEIK